MTDCYTCPACRADLPSLNDLEVWADIPDFPCPACRKQLRVYWDDVRDDENGDYPVLEVELSD